jgi:inositol oxygenase
MPTNNNVKDTEINKQPLASLYEWELDVLQRYPDPDAIAQGKTKEEFRNYDEPQRDTVREFYRLNHKYQTYDFVQQKKADFLQFNKREMPIWNAFDFLNEPWMIPDRMPTWIRCSTCCKLKPSGMTDIRTDGIGGINPRYGRVSPFGEPQWSVIGIPSLLCFSDKIIYPGYDQPDKNNSSIARNMVYLIAA